MSHPFDSIAGVYTYAVEAGIKTAGYDVGILAVPEAVACAGVYTQNSFSASSVHFTKKNMKTTVFKAALITSGNANAATGEQGAQDTKELAQLTAKALGLRTKEVAVANTGIIGVPLPMSVIRPALKAIPSPFESRQGSALAHAILTTDLVEKTVSAQAKVGKKMIQVAGITKGSGMIEPNMATTLGFFVTNAHISQKRLQECLKKAINCSYNMMSVDTDTSTNDMVLCFATGEHKIAENDAEQLEAFQGILNDACIQAAQAIARDGEGASKYIEVEVKEAASLKDARGLAKLVINSPLVKTAIHGEDPNWGRIMMALGKNPAIKINPDKVSIFIGSQCLFKKGVPTGIKRELVKTQLEKKDVYISVECGIGKATASAFGCDLTKGYIDINTDYN